MVYPSKLRASYKSPIAFPAQAVHFIGQPTPNDIVKVQSHVEKRKRERIQWTQDELGNYLADRIATL
jgi:hypothetical protein